MKKLIVFLSLIVLSNIAFSASEQDAELRLYNSGNLYQRFYGVVQQDGDRYVFIHREIPQPPPNTKNYAAWRLVTLQRDLVDTTIFHLQNNIPANKYCIVPFVNGVMFSNFIYNDESNTVQFINDQEEPEIIPEDYSVIILMLLSPQ